MGERGETAASRGSPGASRGSTVAVAFASVAVAGLCMVLLTASNHRYGPAYETSAIAAMRTYCGAQNIFHRTDYDGDGVLEYCGPTNAEHPDFTWLCHATVSGTKIELLDNAFAAATSANTPKAGYWFVEIPLDVDGNPYDAATGYALCAVPAVYNQTGLYTFVVDTQGTVFQIDNGGRPVTRFPDVDAAEMEWIVVE